mmetsp:Transcript_14742/g.23408  ORF Transcript_14742/g.23408 Transcript_14742/m.23408 type:complete len:323 (+) Transcript_14742:356-1324(+)
MSSHDTVQAAPSRLKPLRFCIVLALDISHEFRHAVAMVVGWAEGLLLHCHAWWENHKIDRRNARVSCLACEHREDGGIHVVDGDAVHSDEVAHVVFVRHVVSMPRDDVKWASLQLCLEHTSKEFLKKRVLSFLVLKASCRVQEVARVGKAVRANRAKIREDEVPIEDLTNIASPRAFLRKIDFKLVPSLYHSNLSRLDSEETALRRDQHIAMLRHNEEVTIRIHECLVGHRGVGRVNMNRKARLRFGAPSATNSAHPIDEVNLFLLLRHWERVPAKTLRGSNLLGEICYDVLFLDLLVLPMLTRGHYPIEPGSLIVHAWCRE